ncbi:MAG: hypothetical protein ACXVRK_10350 [Gaiellaceae bacterium]
MKVIATDDARRLISERGGRLFVSVKKARCCGGVMTLAAATAVRNTEGFRSLGQDGGFELLVPRDLARLPDRLEIETRRFPLRVEAYWDGCVWIA